jgi:tetratricopeptide (TPR) repeat protein
VSACEAGADSDIHLFLISGEPGIGKTRLADELAGRVKARGIQVLWGRCWEGDGAPAYWPWIQVIRSFLRTLDPERRANLAVESEIASDMIRAVAQIVPDLRPALTTFDPSVTEKLDPGEARFRLFDAVTNFLKMGARSHPMLIVLDDLHDADETSLALLRFMARELKGTPIMIVATYRDQETRRSPSLSKLIGGLSREARSIPLGGLRESEVSKLVEFRAGQTPDETLVAKLHAATNGNPLFVDGIVRSLMAEGTIDSAGTLDRPFKIPGGIREAIRTRLDGLSPESNSILAAAAAIGNEFEFNLCQSVANVSTDEAHRLLDEAAHAGIVTGLGYGRHRFSHALLREAIYEELDSNGRIRIHGKVATALEEIYREDIGPHLAELAHHFREASAVEKAIDYSVRAGRAAASVFAYTDAMMHQQAALDLMELHGSNALRRADLLVLLGKYAFEVDRATSLRHFQSALALYESLGSLDKATQVHIQLGTIFHMRGQALANAALATDHLRRAELAIVKEPETTDLAQLYFTISGNECAKLNFLEGASAARRAMEISDRLGDRMFWPWAAAAYGECLCMKGQLSDGFTLFERAFEAALEAKRSAYPVAWRAGFDSIVVGDPRGALLWFERERKRKTKDANPLDFRFFSDWIDLARFNGGQLKEKEDDWKNPGSRFWIGGEWEAIAELLERQVESCERNGNQYFALYKCVFGGFTNLLIGEHARAEALFRYGLDNAHPESVVLLEMRARPWLARLYVETNRLDEAAEQVAQCRQIMAAGEDWRGLAGNVLLMEAVVGAQRGNYDIAYRQFEAALEIHKKYHLAWDEAYALQYWGRALAAAGDRIRAAEKFDGAIENHRSRGVGPRFLEWLTADKMRALGGSTSQSKQPADSKLTATFRKEGEFWTISYHTSTFRLRDAKGLHYIAYLLARPGQRIHVHDLIEAVEGCAANGSTTLHPRSEDLEIVREIGGVELTIDARARSAYRSRLRDLQADLDEAQRMNDVGRSERLSNEIEMVGQELAGSSALGGRARATSRSEVRARGLVGKNVRSIVEKIRHQHPVLGRHFATAISTGNFCAYQPEPDHPFAWQL